MSQNKYTKKWYPRSSEAIKSAIRNSGTGGAAAGSDALLLNIGDDVLLNSGNPLLIDGTVGDLTVKSALSGDEEIVVSQSTTDAKMSLQAIKNGLGIATGTVVTDNYYVSQANRGSLGSNLLTAADFIYVKPIIIRETTTFNRIGIDVDTAGASGEKARMCIYTADLANGIPDTLVLDSGEVDIDSTGHKEVAISQELKGGVYYIGYVHDSATAKFHQVLGAHGCMYYGMTDASTYITNMQGTHTYAALPASFPSVTYPTGNNSSYVWLRSV